MRPASFQQFLPSLLRAMRLHLVAGSTVGFAVGFAGLEVGWETPSRLPFAEEDGLLPPVANYERDSLTTSLPELVDFKLFGKTILVVHLKFRLLACQLGK